MVKAINKPSKVNCFAVIVTYFPKEDLSVRIDDLLKEVSKVIVVDNDSDYKSHNVFEILESKGNVVLVKNKKNMGIAFALNKGLNLGFSMGFEWVLTLDQDSVIKGNFIDEYINAYLECKASVFIIGCNYYNANKGRNLFNQDGEGQISCKKVKSVITSGTLTHKTVFDKVGMFREDFFIDSVDHEFCLRARRKGFNIVAIKMPLLIQSIGEKRKKKFIGRLINSYTHAPIRNYYIARNTILVIKEYFIFDPLSCVDHIGRLLIKVFSIVLTEPDKRKKMFLFIKGVYHGLFNKVNQL